MQKLAEVEKKFSPTQEAEVRKIFKALDAAAPSPRERRKEGTQARVPS
jgi:hypothetical protein